MAGTLTDYTVVLTATNERGCATVHMTECPDVKAACVMAVSALEEEFQNSEWGIAAVMEGHHESIEDGVPTELKA